MKVWDLSLHCQHKIKPERGDGVKHTIKSVWWHEEKFMVGTIRKEIWELWERDGRVVGGNDPVEQVHLKKQAWGLTVDPSNPRFATVGDDVYLRV